MKRIPANLGFRFQGDIEAALREANATEFNDVRNLVHGALSSVIHNGSSDRWVDLVAIYANEAVVDLKGMLWMYGYSIDADNRVTLGQPRQVVRTYVPVGVTQITECIAPGNPQAKFSPAPHDPSNSILLESLDSKTGLKWRVTVVQAGLSGNNNYYPDAVLREACSLFDGVRVFNKSDAEHLAGNGKSFDNLIGKLVDPVFIEGSGTDTGRIEATLNLIPAGTVPEKVLEAYNANMHDLFGFSIDVWAQSKKTTRGKIRVTEAGKFTKVNSLDLIIEPGAGGTLLNLLEAKGATMTTAQRLLAALNKHGSRFLEGVDQTSEEELLEAHDKMLEALANPEPAKPAKVEKETPAAVGITHEQLQEALGTERARTFAVSSLNVCNLPPMAKTQLQTQFDADDKLTNERVTEAIKGMQELVGSFSKSGHIKMDGIMHGNVDDGKQVLEALFDPDNKDVTSLREAYLNCTGDKHFTGMLRDCSRTRLAEALDSSSFPDALGEAMHKRMLDLYKNATIYDNWRNFADIVSVNDFRNQERISIGGYGDLAAVAESGAYPALTSPTDSKEAYSVSKRGGTESVTLEMIANDDVGALMRMPGQMVMSGKRTLSKFVWNMFVSNPTMNDTFAWFHANHGNLGTTAFSAAAYAAGRLAMMRQVEPGSNAELGLMSKYLLVPAELEEAAVNAFNRDTNLDATFAQSLKPTIVPVWCWTDANDWVQTCDKAEQPIIELGFFQGREEPELFIQDNPTVGSMFTNDTTTYKIRHIYGGAPMSALGVRKNVVA